MQKAALLVGSREPENVLLVPECPLLLAPMMPILSLVSLPIAHRYPPGEAQQLMGASQILSGCRLQEDRALGIQGASGETLGSSFRETGLYGVLGLRHLPQFCTEILRI